jgi:pheromone shutdown protein TraB
LGWQITNAWFLINGGLAALGAIIALAHPLTIIGVFAAAPLTSLNPFIGAGFVAAAIELFFKKPRVGDFSDLRQDVTTARGWWRNRVARTLLVFILTTLGSAIGTYIGGFRIVTLLRG